MQKKSLFFLFFVIIFLLTTEKLYAEKNDPIEKNFILNSPQNKVVEKFLNPFKDENETKNSCSEEDYTVEEQKIETQTPPSPPPTKKVLPLENKKNYPAPKKKDPYVGIGKPKTILYKTKKVDGKRVCKKNKDNPGESDKNKKWHVDTECCLDKDEIPNSNCYYPPEKYGKLIERYLKKKAEGKIK